MARGYGSNTSEDSCDRDGLWASSVLRGGLAGLGTLGAWMQVVLCGLGVALMGLGRGVRSSWLRVVWFLNGGFAVQVLDRWVVRFSAVERPACWWVSVRSLGCWVSGCRSFGSSVVVCGAGVGLLSFRPWGVRLLGGGIGVRSLGRWVSWRRVVWFFNGGFRFGL